MTALPTPQPPVAAAALGGHATEKGVPATRKKAVKVYQKDAHQHNENLLSQLAPSPKVSTNVVKPERIAVSTST